MGQDAVILVFWILSFKPASSLPLSLSSRGSLVPLHFLPLEWSHLYIWCCWSFSWQSWFQLMIHPAQHFAWCTLHRRRRQWQLAPVLLPGKPHGQRSLVSCSPWGPYKSDTAERLHFHFSLSRIGEGNGNLLQYSKQGDNIQPWCTPFPIWNQSVFSMYSSNCCFLTRIQVSQETDKVVWYSHLFKNFPQFVVVHTVRSFSIVSEAEVDVFLKFFFLWSSGYWQFHLWFLCLF